MKRSFDIALIGLNISSLGALCRLLKGRNQDRICIIGEFSSSCVYSNGSWENKPVKSLEFLDQDLGHEVGEIESKNAWADEVSSIFSDLLVRSEKDMWLVDGWSRLYRTRVAQKLQAYGDLGQYLLSKSECRVGLLQLGDVSISPYPAAEYNSRWSPNRSIFIDIDIPIDIDNPSPFVLAQRFLSDESMLNSFLKRLAEKSSGCDLLLCPPVFGLKESTSLHSRFAQACNCDVAELLSNHPSPAGVRLFHSLKNWFDEIEVPIFEGSLKDIEWRNRRVASMSVKTQDKNDIAIEAKQIVLCSEAAMGGGIVMEPQDESPVERIFKIPATWLEQEQQNTLPGALGILVNEDSMPVTTSGRIIAENLFVGGSATITYPPQKESKANPLHSQTSESFGLGDSFQKGFQAAEHALQNFETERERN